MATQIDKSYSRNMGQVTLFVLEATLITSGTTITFTLAPGTRILGNPLFHNRTTDAMTTGGTYDEATGVWVSGTMAVNDQCTVAFIIPS